MFKVDFIFCDAGGGHRSAATALKAVVESRLPGWNVRLVSLQEVLDPLDLFLKLTGVRLEDVYNRMLANGWTLGAGPLLRLLQTLLRIYRPQQVKLLAKFWRTSQPDMVVSLLPNFNRALLLGLRASGSDAPFVTILTDLADYPPHFWIERQRQYLICGTDKAVEQAYSLGFSPEEVFRVSGMILRPGFYKDFRHDRSAELSKLGLDPAKRTGLVLFGGQGSPDMLTILRRLEAFSDRLQLIFICGQNAELARRLRQAPGRLTRHIVEFTEDVPYFMSLSDFFIGKPGPGSISEAFAMGLPVIVERNAWTLPQERFNCDWVERHVTGLVVPSFSRIAEAVVRMCDEETLNQLRRNVSLLKNQAVFEIPEILNRIGTPASVRRAV